MRSARGRSPQAFALALLLMVGTLLSAPAMVLHGRAEAARHDHHAHHPATPGQQDCCDWCLSNCVAPATLPQVPTIAVLSVPAAAVAAVSGPGRLAAVRTLLLPYPLGPPASLSV
jgi:hypothetical protein